MSELDRQVATVAASATHRLRLDIRVETILTVSLSSRQCPDAIISSLDTRRDSNNPRFNYLERHKLYIFFHSAFSKGSFCVMSVVIMNHPRNTDTSHKVRKEVRYPYK
jgi:hypothetical protein